MNKLIAFSAAAFFAATSASFAADAIGIPAPIAPAPVYDSSSVWDGFYAGLNAGYGWGEFDIDGLGGDDIEGWFGGAQVGYNAAFGGVVVGIEGDYQYSDINWTATDGVIDVDAGINHFGTVRGRLGADLGTFMPYVTAGIAFGEIGAEATDGTVTLSDSEYGWGWAVGAGVEAMLADNVSLKGEYLYVDFQNFDFDGVDVDAHAHTARIGVNFHF